MREIATKKKPVFVQANFNSGQGHVLHYITSFCYKRTGSVERPLVPVLLRITLNEERSARFIAQPPPCTDPSQATARFVIVASQHALKEKFKYCLYPKEHSTVEKGRWKTKGRGILFRVESLWMQVKVKNSCELKRYVSQNIRTIRSNSWNCTENKFGVLANL